MISPHTCTARDSEIIDIIDQAISWGDLVGLRPLRSGMHAGGNRDLEERRLVRAVQGELSAPLAYRGRRYALTAGADLPGAPNRNSYEVVSREEAAVILRAIVAESPGSARLAAALENVVAKLSPDWRPPGTPKGIVLLRRTVGPRVASATNAPAITPSQMRAMMDSSWIEVEFVDEEGEPVDVAYHLELSDGSIDDGESDEGLLAKPRTKPGTCKLTLPKLDRTRWRVS